MVKDGHDGPTVPFWQRTIMYPQKPSVFVTTKPLTEEQKQNIKCCTKLPPKRTKSSPYPYILLRKSTK